MAEAEEIRRIPTVWFRDFTDPLGRWREMTVEEFEESRRLQERLELTGRP